MKKNTMIGRAALVAAALLTLTGIQAAHSETITVAVEAASGQPTEQMLRGIVKDAPLAVVSAGTPAIVETDAIGYDRLLADDTLTLVRRVDVSAQAARAAAVSGSVQWTLQLDTQAAGSNAGQMTAADSAGAAHAARATDRRALADDAPRAGMAGPGKLVVRGLDGQGREVARAVVNDPRLVRYEGGSKAGQLTTRRDFVRTRATLRVVLPADARIASLSIAQPLGAGRAAALKELARVPAR